MQASNMVTNGSFSRWEDESPVGWSIEIGATDGANSPKSRITESKEGGVRLSGDSSTRAWKFLSQSIDANAGDVIHFSFRAKSEELKQQGAQKDNCFVGFVPTDANGQRLAPLFQSIENSESKSFSHYINCPKKMAKAEVWIFLSKTGKLTVSDLRIEKQLPKDSFDVLVESMRRNYSFFDLKKVDWTKLTEKYREQATSAESSSEFSKVVSKMLGELKDIHVWVMHNQMRTETYTKAFDSNSDFNVISRQIRNSGRFLGLGIVADTKDNFCYVNLRNLTLPKPILIRHPLPPDHIPSRKSLDAIIDKIVQRFDSPGLILDLRRNVGGSEEIAKEIAGLFVNRETTYAKSTYRTGDEPTEFGPEFERTFLPTKQTSYKGEIVCLIGPGTVSSAEGLALMMKALPNCTLIGQSTRGASGNPRPIMLPNGVEVWYSRWKSLLPDGTCFEGVGIQPDIFVEHLQDFDPTFDKAVELLKSKTKNK